MKLKNIISGLVTISIGSVGAFAEVNTNSCAGCHGTDFQASALGRSKIVKNMTADEIEKALIGYKNGTYGGSMKGIMKGQVSKYSENELKAVAQKISGNDSSEYKQDELNDLMKAANQGNAEAQLKVGNIYHKRRNTKDAAKWYKKAANQGNAEAQLYLGFYYLTGAVGLEPDHTESQKWFQKACDNGNEKACSYLIK